MRTILIYSGGLDSTVALYELLTQGHEVKALSVDYGQRHKKELIHAGAICAKLGVEHRIADLSAIVGLLAGSSQTSSDVDVPEGHYAEESMKKTIVPNRNMILLAVAFGWAISVKADAVAYAAHNGDHAIYPDCRPEFAQAVAEAARFADWHQVQLLTPFINVTKADIARRGFELSVPMQETWSCYKGGALHCGKCGTCVERIEAFTLADVEDFTEYLNV